MGVVELAGALQMAPLEKQRILPAVQRAARLSADPVPQLVTGDAAHAGRYQQRKQIQMPRR